MSDLQPDIDDVLQEEPELDVPAVAVAVAGPVRTQQLPRKGGATRTYELSSTVVKELLTADPRRARATLVSHSEDFLVAYSLAGAEHPSSMARIPKNVLFEVGATVDVFVMAQANTTTLSVVTEMWAEG